MPLPDFNEHGDLPEGKHLASLEDVINRFGSGSVQRLAVTRRLQEIYDLAESTGYIDRLIIFGSYVSNVPDPRDIDLILVMKNDFHVERCGAEAAILFDHRRAHDELGASLFWVRPDMLLMEPLEEFLALWQRKRDGSRRGIVEIHR